MQSLREYLTRGAMLSLCHSCASRVVCLRDEIYLFPPFNTAGGIETHINYSASKNAEEQEVLSPHSTNQSALMTLDHLVWKTDGEHGGSQRICAVSPVQMRAVLFPGAWRCTLLIKLCQIGRSW